jgi:hypothetical protein
MPHPHSNRPRTDDLNHVPAVERRQAVVSFGCAAGVQALAERFPGKPVHPGLNTQFLGILEEQATWTAVETLFLFRIASYRAIQTLPDSTFVA